MTASPTIAAIRFGYGLSPTRPPPDGAAEILAALDRQDRAADRFPVMGMQQAAALARDLRTAVKARDNQEAGAEEMLQKARQALLAGQVAGLIAQIQRGVQSTDAFRERLHFFWSDHFTVVAKGGALRAAPSAFAEEAIRPHLTGRFADMLRAAVTHPAMLLYLDQNVSIGPDSPVAQRRAVGLNENLAREVLELHTLGVDAAYTQADVRQFAKLLTGLGYNLKRGFRFHPQWAQPGAERVLGRRYGGDEPARLDEIFAALDDIAAHPDTAQHIARKLAVHFVSDTPDEELVDHVAAAFRRSEGHLPTVYAALLEHPAAWAPLGGKARQPWDFVVASLRALAVPPERLAGLSVKQARGWLIYHLTLMGQPYQKPSGPDGWPEDAAAWITPQGLAARIQWAMLVHRLHGGDLPDPRAFVRTALADAASPTLITAAARAESRREGIGLILASADFNRR